MLLTVNAFLSLDGVMQGPGGAEEDTTGNFARGGWLMPHFDADTGAVVDGWFARTEALLLGRTTYELMQPHWSQVTDPDDHVAATLNNGPKYLVSTTMQESAAPWKNTTILRSTEDVRGVKDQPGGELQVHGSLALARSLHDAGLVDEYRLIVFPVVVGQGRRLFGDGCVPSGFSVVSHSITSTGAVALTLRPVPFTTGMVTVEDGRDTIV